MISVNLFAEISEFAKDIKKKMFSLKFQIFCILFLNGVSKFTASNEKTIKVAKSGIKSRAWRILMKVFQYSPPQFKIHENNVSGQFL